MTLRKVTIDVDVPDDWEVEECREVGRARCTGKHIVKYVVTFKEKEPPPPGGIVQGPKKWEALKWAAKDGDSKWYLYTAKPEFVCNVKGWRWKTLDGQVMSALSVNWELPPEVADLPPNESLVRLRHTCQWKRRSSDWWTLECQGKLGGYYHKPPYCPNCGRKVEVIDDGNA